MNDNEQIRLLTEIRDTLKSQLEWEQQIVQKRGNSTILVILVFILLMIGGVFLATKLGQADARRLMEEHQKLLNPGT